MRRLRRTENIRALRRETRVDLDDLIMPIFVAPGAGAPEPIASMPGVLRRSLKDAAVEARRLAGLGVRALALFPCTESDKKDARGSHALDDDNLALQAIRALKDAVPDLTPIADVALDPYTSHGHDGVLTPDGGAVDNDATVEILAQMAVKCAEAGVDWAAPSDMMDGRVAALRAALDQAGHTEVGILSYAAKYASAYYGPFRDAIGSQQAAGKTYLDKRAYQLDPANPRESIEDALLDEAEGADILMVKPAGPYLDIIRDLRRASRLPIAAYQVSGEFSQIHAAAQMGWLDLKATRDESLLSVKRAGADMILTYFTQDIAHERNG